MKRAIITFLCVGLVAIMMVGCGYKDALASNSSTSATTETKSTNDEANEKKVSDADYKDNFDGLCSYFADLGYIDTKDGKIDDSKAVVMDYALIGATAGKKFTTQYVGNQVLIELYAYDTNKLNDEAKKVIESVKKDGTFTILDLPAVKATLSDNGKYLMIYTDNSIDESKPKENFTHREDVMKSFKSFHK